MGSSLSSKDSMFQDQHPVRYPLGLGIVVGRHNDHGPAFFFHVLDNRLNDRRIFLINGRGRLIKEEDLGSRTRARAMPRRWVSPLESVRACWLFFRSSPTKASVLFTRDSISSWDSPRTLKAICNIP